MTPADSDPHEDEIAGLLIETAFDLVAKGGWANFSLRAVAESIGAAGSAASHRFGDRAGLVSAVCDAAIQRDAAQMDRFLPGVAVDTPGAHHTVAAYQLVLQALRDPFLATLSASVRRRLGEGEPDAGLQAIARREAAAMLDTALTLTGQAAGGGERRLRAG